MPTFPRRGATGLGGSSAVCGRPVTAPWAELTGRSGPAGTPKNRTPGAYPKAEADPGRTPMTLARQGERVNTWSWTEDLLVELEASFSPERLRTYLRAAKGDRKRALQLYTWNTKICAAFYGPLQGLEIALRNAIHQQLTRCYGAAWHDNPAVGLDLGGLERIAAAKTETARGHAATPGRLVAALSFGFWVSLLGSGGRMDSDGRRANYEMTLWRPALRRAFPHRMPLTRKQAHRPLNALRQTAQSDRPSRAGLCEVLASGSPAHPRCNRLDFARGAGVGRAP